MNKRKAYHQVYYRTHSKRIKARVKAYYEANPEKARTQRKVNRSYHKIYYKTWAKANKEHKKTVDKAYCKANSEQIKVKKKAYREANKEKIRDRYKSYCKANTEAIRQNHRKQNRKRRALKRTLQIELINEKIVYLRDGWKCQICHKRVDKRLKYPNPMSASLDHIIPLSEGGSHTYANVQLTHLQCNMTKHNNTIPQGEQMRLF